MYRRIPAVAAALMSLVCVLSTPARADNMNMPAGEHKKGSIGFHNITAPLGVRWWLMGEKVALDLGLGFHSEKAVASGYPNEKVTGWAVDVGVPIVMKSWNRVHVLFRPGILYESQQEVVTSPPTAFDTDNEKTFNLSGEIEAEAFLLDNFSVSASTGIAYQSIDPVGPGDKITSFSTIGNEFTNVGFHIYLF
jgi:hypothetical protein